MDSPSDSGYDASTPSRGPYEVRHRPSKTKFNVGPKIKDIHQGPDDIFIGEAGFSAALTSLRKSSQDTTRKPDKSERELGRPSGVVSTSSEATSTLLSTQSITATNTVIFPKESIIEEEYIDIPPSHDVPTPPLPNPPTFQGIAGRRMPISHPPQHSLGQSNLNFLSAQPISHVSTSPKFLDTKENYQMTDELLAAIERTDKQQAQYRSVQSHPYLSAHGVSPYSGVSNQPRDATSSPSLQDRPRALTAQSVPHQSIPAVLTDNSSWKTPSDPLTRLLPFPNPFQDIAGGRMSPLPPQQSQSQSNITSHYAQPVPRVPTGPFLNKSQDVETWQMIKGLFADIENEGANKQQCQSVQSHSFPSVCNNSPSPRGPVIGRLCWLTDKSSPENGQRRLREQALACESFRTRERRPPSPSVASFTQARLQSLTLEHQVSPAQDSLVLSAEPHSVSYPVHYNTLPPVHHRVEISKIHPNASVVSETPHLQTISACTPDRFPLQEEDSDEITSENGVRHHEN